MAKGPMGENWKQLSSMIGVGTQKKERPQIDVLIEHLITDPILKDRLERVVELLKENKVKLDWFTTSHYKCKYKKEVIFQIKLGDGFKFRENEVYITAHTASPPNIRQFEQFITEEMRKLIIVDSANFKVCNGTNPCKKRSDFEFEGKQYKSICAGNINIDFPLYSDTPNLAEQFQMIEDFIKAKIKFSDAARSK
jgi:hypothetical protein